jgi:YidC/Oxa1 family membrane protein insertase
MDKRSFAFIALFSLSLLAVNAGFHFWNQKQKQDYLAQKRSYETYLQTRQRTQLLNYRIPVDKLNVIDCKEEGWGLRFKQLALLVDFAHPLPIFEGKEITSECRLSLPCSIYLDPSNENDWLHALKSFKPTPGQLQNVTLAARINGAVYTFSAQADHNLIIHSITGEDSSNVNPAHLEKGLILINQSGQPFPVGSFVKSGADFIGSSFAAFNTIADKINYLPTAPDSLPQETFYLLENEYLQLIISSKGGAIAEINLPFDKTNSVSVVKEVELDKKLIDQSPENARYPLRLAQRADQLGKISPVIAQEGGFYPLLRRGILSKNDWKKPIEAKDYALSLVSDFPEVANLDYQLVEFTADKLVLESVQPNRRITRTYEMPRESKRAPYSFDSKIKIDGDKTGLWISSGVPEAEIGSAAPLPILKYRQSQGSKVDIKNFELPAQTLEITETHPDWICNGNAFFGIFLDPIRNQFPGLKIRPITHERMPSRLSLIDEDSSRFKPSALTGYQMLLPFPHHESESTLRIIAGPLADTVLEKLDETFSQPEERYNPEYLSSLSFNGWFSIVLRPFSNFMMLLMNLFHTVTHSWAAAIFLLTVTLRLMLYPLNAWSNTSMKKMQELSPKIKALQDRYKDDPKKAQMEMVVLYREHKVNPLSGCLPIVIQIPFLFSMMHIFKTNFSLRGASFIPGWIDDLAAPDVLFSWNYSLPFIGSDFHLLPILLGGAMFAQSLLMSNKTTEVSDAQRQQKAMSNVMTLAFTFMFYSLPSGLNLYWLASSILGMAQQYWGQRSQQTIEVVKASGMKKN